MTTEALVLPVTAPAQDVPGPAQGSWTYTPYAALPDDGRRFEVADGVLYMTPAPNTPHQRAIGEIFHYVRQYAKQRKAGHVFLAPYDVELSPKSIVQPDVLFVAFPNEGIIHPSHIKGVPDLVIEVTSPSSETYDRGTKLELYAAAGVQEYWIVDPEAETVELRTHDAGSGTLRSVGVYRRGATLASRVLPNFPTAVEDFFA